MRVIVLMAFFAILAALLGSQFHIDFLESFCSGLALAFSGILALQLFTVRSVEPQDADESTMTELHLSR
ncbi:MAG TPA: hypothetical protein VJS11_00045 [Acidobacteriaceae bacterium]|nr:hypothetical protein [Acidobacteriaceae bacterium]